MVTVERSRGISLRPSPLLFKRSPRAKRKSPVPVIRERIEPLKKKRENSKRKTPRRKVPVCCVDLPKGNEIRA